MLAVRHTDAAKLTIEELAAGLPDGGLALHRELKDAEQAIRTFPRSGKERFSGHGVTFYSLTSRSGKYQILYLYDEEAQLIEIDGVVPTRSSMRR